MTGKTVIVPLLLGTGWFHPGIFIIRKVHFLYDLALCLSETNFAGVCMIDCSPEAVSFTFHRYFRSVGWLFCFLLPFLLRDVFVGGLEARIPAYLYNNITMYMHPEID
jgi:hypothetical protein